MSTQTQALYEKVARELTARALAVARGQIKAIILYGSVARRESDEDSDIDLLIVADSIKAVRERLSFIRAELDLEHETLTTLAYKTPEQLREGAIRGDPFLLEVLREGRALYDDGTFERIRREVSKKGK